MPVILEALRKALRDLCRPQVLLMVAVPILCAAAVWMLIGWLCWARLTAWVNAWLQATSLAHWLGEWATGALRVAGSMIAVALLMPGVMLTALLMTELFTMPGLVNHVATHDFPNLVRRRGGTLGGSVRNTTVAIVRFAVLWLVTFPLWFTGIGALVIPAFNAAYLNQRVFRYDALAEHADADELRTVIDNHKRQLYGLGLCLSVFYYVPLLNLLAPALSGLAFTHFQLHVLARLRTKKELGVASGAQSSILITQS